MTKHTTSDTVSASLLFICYHIFFFAGVSINSLRNVALTKSQHVPSLNSVIPYLDVTTNQEYLINRIEGLYL